MKQRVRCDTLKKQPGVQGEWMQCINPATMFQYVAGCDCAHKDGEFCREDQAVPICAGPCNFGQ